MKFTWSEFQNRKETNVLYVKVSDYDEESINVGADLAQIQSRTPTNRLWSSTSNQLQPQKRLFFGLNPFFSSNYTPFWLAASSTLTTVTVSSTVLTAVVSTCIPSSQFAAGSANVVCARRKRQVIGADYLFDDSEDKLSPTLVQRYWYWLVIAWLFD